MMTAGVEVTRTRRRLRIARGGRLLPWLGPALRGLAGGRLRAAACRLPVSEQLTTFARCAGCALMRGCAYGETYEPDPPPGSRLAAGWENTARPIVIGAEFPLRENAAPGYEFEVSATLVGAAAARHAAAFWEALRIGGADLALGLGDEHVLFDLVPAAEANEPGEERAVVDLPLAAPQRPEMARRVRVELTSPLFLQETDGRGQRGLVLAPTFGQLARAGLRVLGPLHRLYAEALPDAIFGVVKEQAENVPMTRHEFRPFQQRKWSHRTKERLELTGVTGWAEYGPAPRWLTRWLEWAGRLHVGTHRVAGAGGWRVALL